jgi:hypothetical protein
MDWTIGAGVLRRALIQDGQWKSSKNLEYDKELYKQRNEADRIFRRLKGYRRIAARYDKLYLMFSAYIYLALCVIAVDSLIPRSVNSLLELSGRTDFVAIFTAVGP